jgi:hypothetical protein
MLEIRTLDQAHYKVENIQFNSRMGEVATPNISHLATNIQSDQRDKNNNTAFRQWSQYSFHCV